MTIKNIFLFVGLAVVVCISVSCRKHSDHPSTLDGTTLTGTWEIRGMGGPLIDVNPDAFKPGNGNTWSFSSTDFAQRTKDSVYKTGTYTVDNSGINPVDNKPVKRFIFNGIPSESFELRSDSLYVYSIRTDEFQSTSVYVKISYLY